MAEPTPEERRKELAEAFADGLDIFESRTTERKAKEAAEKGDDGKGGKDDNDPPKSWRDRLLG